MSKHRPKYTDMCIYIDNNILNPDADVVKIYDYLIKISKMLAEKKRLFQKPEDYEGFAIYFANIVYLRMTTPRQYLADDDPKKLEPIKSCLNYMKKAIYPRSCNYRLEEFSVLSKDTDEVAFSTFKQQLQSAISDTNDDMVAVDIEEYFKNVKRIVMEEVKTGVYGNDKVTTWKLYTACLISLLRNFTLCRSNARRLKNYKKFLVNIQGDGTRKVIARNDYEDILANIVQQEEDSAPTPYDLDDDFSDYIAYSLQRIKRRIIQDIKEITYSFDYPDELIEDILLSGWSEEQEND